MQMPLLRLALQETIKLVEVAGSEKEITLVEIREATQKMAKLLVGVVLAPKLKIQGKARIQCTKENNQQLHLSQKRSLQPSVILR